MRVGVVVLPDQPWAEAAPRWRAVEQLGFDHAWTYDHLVWGGLPDSPWYAAVPTLAAAATVTERVSLGTFVASPNFRHPVALWREVQALDDLSGGRFLLGLGTGGDRDAEILGGPPLAVGERIERFQEFTDLLVRLRAEDHVDAAGHWYAARDARTLPAVRSVPLLVAGNGPRSVRYAARTGDGWVTAPGGDTDAAWVEGLRRARDTLEAALAAAGRDAAAFPRFLSVDTAPGFALDSVDRFEELVGVAEGLGFTDVVTHWPRAEAPYAGSERVLEQVAERLRGR